MIHFRSPASKFRLFGCLAAVALIPAQTVFAEDPATARARRRSPVVEVFEHCRNAVVNISSTRVVEVRPFFGGIEEMLPDLFNLPPQGYAKQQAVGSGFVIDPDGY